MRNFESLNRHVLQRWYAWLFLTGWLAAAVYNILLLLHSFFGFPWFQPLAGGLIVLFVLGMTCLPIGMLLELKNPKAQTPRCNEFTSQIQFSAGQRWRTALWGGFALFMSFWLACGTALLIVALISLCLKRGQWAPGLGLPDKVLSIILFITFIVAFMMFTVAAGIRGLRAIIIALTGQPPETKG